MKRREAGRLEMRHRVPLGWSKRTAKQTAASAGRDPESTKARPGASIPAPNSRVARRPREKPGIRKQVSREDTVTAGAGPLGCGLSPHGRHGRWGASKGCAKAWLGCGRLRRLWGCRSRACAPHGTLSRAP